MATEGQTASDDSQSNLALLEQRLCRLEFLLTGSSDLNGIPDGVNIPQKSDDTVTAKLAQLQGSLDRLRRLDGAAGFVVREVEAIYAKYPEILVSNVPVPIKDVSTQASVVLSHATLYPENASRLSSLQSLQIPPAEQSAKLSELTPHIETCQRTQTQLEEEVQDLRQRSATCLEWWVKVGIVGIGDLWEEWEDRLKDVERQVGRFERRQKEEEGYI